MKLLGLLLLLLLPLTAGTVDFKLPNPPTDQVLDRSHWFDTSASRQINNELRRIRKEHHIDVLVVIWDRALPLDRDLEALARRVGEEWAREDLWAVVLQVPDTVNPPSTAYQGTLLESLRADAVEATVRKAISRGMRGWTNQDQTQGVALNLAEELVYLRLRHHHERSRIQEAMTTARAGARQRRQSLVIGVCVGLMVLLLLAGLIIWFRMNLGRRSRPDNYQFPDTRWRRRLGAPWCGGSDLVTTFRPPSTE